MNDQPTAAPMTAKKRVSIFSPWANRMVSVSPYSPKAKKLYRYYIQEFGYAPSWIVPPDLKFHVGSGRFTRTKAPPTPAIEARTSYKNYLGSYSLHNTGKVMGLAGFELMNHFIPKLTELLALHGGVKFQASARCLMNRTLEGEVIAQVDNFYINSFFQSVNNPSQIADAVKAAVNHMKELVPEKETQGTGWVFQRIVTLDVHVAKYKPLKGSSWFDLPQALKLKKAIVNVKNADQQCFKWAVLSALFPAAKAAQRVGKYVEHEQKLDWSGLPPEGPVTLQDIPKFERRNSASVNVYGWDEKKKGGHLLQKSKLVLNAKRHVDLLLLEQGSKTHYCWIKSFSRFARQPSDYGHQKKHYCHYCLHGFPSAAKLTPHLKSGCREITEARPVLPEPGSDKSFVEFKSPEKQHKAPFVIYADFEALTKPLSSTERNPQHSYTEAYQTHEPCGFCVHVVSSDPKHQFDPVVYRGENTIEEFIFKMKELEAELTPLVKAVEPMVMTKQDEKDFKCAKTCCFCKKPLGDDRVRDHDHLTGKYRGAAHNSCNLEEGKKRTRHYQIPVFFHNLKGYDSHLIMSEIGKHTSKLSAIPQNFEKMISFTFSHLKFLDSMGFLAAPLDTLVRNLSEDGRGKHKFIHSTQHCAKPEHLDLLLKKGVYPYDYMSDWSRFDETELPPQEAFYSKLSESDITAGEYAHAQQVWQAFGCQTLGDYHDLYMLTDVLLLADVFESFRSLCLDYYELDPAHYFTTPNFAWDAMLKLTKVKLELLTDYDQYLMVEQGLRGGIAMISHRHAEANNPQMGDSYDEAKEHSYISYLDANNLYGHAMVRPLPCGDFRWETERDADRLIEQYSESSDRGCIVKCDLEYPEELHDEHNDYPLAPERKLVTQDMLSPYALSLQEQLKIGKDTAEKLVPNLNDKHGYVVDIRNLKFYVDHGLKVTKVHSVISFKQTTWLKPYIDFNTEKRKQAKNDFEKDFFKLMCNSCFGKTMENVRNRVNMSFVTSNSAWGGHAIKHDRTVERKIASPLYDGHIIFNEDLAAIKMKKKQIVLN